MQFCCSSWYFWLKGEGWRCCWGWMTAQEVERGWNPSHFPPSLMRQSLGPWSAGVKYRRYGSAGRQLWIRLSANLSGRSIIDQICTFWCDSLMVAYHDKNSIFVLILLFRIDWWFKRKIFKWWLICPPYYWFFYEVVLRNCQSMHDTFASNQYKNIYKMINCKDFVKNNHILRLFANFFRI